MDILYTNRLLSEYFFFFFNDTATTEIYTLSLHDALPIYEQAKKGFQTSINKLGTDYLDLYLIHRPAGDVKGSWKAMEELYHQGKIKAIGVSNFDPAQLEDLIASNDVKPAINQIETHAFFQEGKSLEYLKQHGVQMEAQAAFAGGRYGGGIDMLTG